MKECMFKSYEELPLFLNADTVAKALGIALSSAYELRLGNDVRTLGGGDR